MNRKLFAGLAALFLAACLLFPALHFFGKMGEQNFKTFFSLTSFGWFVCAWAWLRKKNGQFRSG